MVIAKACGNCGSQFIVDDADRAFLQKVAPRFNGDSFELPEPRNCPDCRTQGRMAWRSELNLFRRKSDFSGRDIVSMFPSDAPCRVYSVEEWWTDTWDGLSYGREFDFTRTFAEQFDALLSEVPLLALQNQSNGENAEYTNCSSYARNCYLIGGANSNEDCQYANYINRSKNCLDCNFVSDCELCYECVDCKSCYGLHYSRNCQSCADSYFLVNCRGCTDCYGCANLTNKQYHFENVPLPRQEYFERLRAVPLESRSFIRAERSRLERIFLRFPNRFQIGTMNENVTGNVIFSSRNVDHCFDASDIENCRYAIWLHKAKDCWDIYSWGFTAELCYQCAQVGDNSYHALFCVSSHGSTEALYSHTVLYCRYVFGCVGLRHKEHCIFNVQYSEREYHRLARRIVRHMRDTGEWGEFFPMRLSRIPYNASLAQDYFPLDRQAVERRGLRWREETLLEQPSFSFAVPDRLSETDDAILSKVLVCESSRKPYKINPRELKFYRERGIPVPELCFFERHKRRLAQRLPRRLWDRHCERCGMLLKTAYAPQRPEIVFCESCYQESMD